MISFLDPTLPVYESFEGKGVFLAGVIRKLLIHGLLLVINIINFVTEAVWKGTQACYIWGFGRRCSSSLLSPVQQHLLSSLSKSCCTRGGCAMEGQGENVSSAVGKKHVSGVGSRRVMDAMEGGGSSPAIVQAGSSLRRPLVIDMEAARKAVSGFLVVGRLLSPFQVNPRVIIGDLRNMT